MVPGFPNGTPAVITSRSPGEAKPRCGRSAQAAPTAAPNVVTFSVYTQWVPQNICVRRAVSRELVSVSIAPRARSRAMRAAVEPLAVYVTITVADMVRAICDTAAEIASSATAEAGDEAHR